VLTLAEYSGWLNVLLSQTAIIDDTNSQYITLKLKLMKTQLIILPECNIIVSDEEIKEEDLLVDLRTLQYGKIYTSIGFSKAEGYIGWIKCDTGIILNQKDNQCKKLIASTNPEHNLPSINYNGLEEEFGIVNVEKLADEFYQNYQSQPYAMEKGAWRQGFKKAQSLSDKKFSLEDMLVAFNKGAFYGSTKCGNTQYFEEVIQSLQQPKSWNIKVEVNEDFIKILNIID
jgi:ADP-heptose:LPS heptosyltransferase